ncbi:Hsp20/alpha crystallin family protein [Cooperia oncophora]
MSICLFPTTPMLPRLLDDVFAEISDIDRALRRHSRKESIAVGQLDKVDPRGRVEGKQETKEEHGYAMRSFVRQWTLPEDVNVDELRSTITEEGHLSIEAPKLKVKPALNAKNIPIQKAVKDQ